MGYHLFEKENGGPRVRRLKKFNLALFDKWCWRILNETKCVCYRVLCARYGEVVMRLCFGVVVE